MSNSASKPWEKFTTPEILQRNLLLASLYLSAYEILKSTLIQRPQEFFTRTFKDGKRILDAEYEVVEKLHKSPLQASCLWFKDLGAITDQDIDKVHEFREHRNQLAHDLLPFLGDVDQEINLQHLRAIYDLLKKVDTWWVKEIELPCNPDYDEIEVSDEDIIPGSVLLISLLLQTALQDK